MSKTAGLPSHPPKSKKEIRNLIQQKLTLSLADFRSIVGEKKFDKQIKKSAKKWGDDVRKALPKKSKKVQPEDNQ